MDCPLTQDEDAGIPSRYVDLFKVWETGRARHYSRNRDLPVLPHCVQVERRESRDVIIHNTATVGGWL